jgi:radical SAM superfamily enzyme YgiQ (UPF0313 family)
MKVLFIHEYLPQEMLGIMWLSRKLKDAGHETNVLFIPDSKWLERAVTYNPDIVAYSTTTGMHLYIAEISRSVKRVLPNALSVVGGPHPSFSPEFVEEEGIDAICRGEGEHAFVELCDKMEAGEDYYNTPNFWFKHPETGEIIKNCLAPLVDNLDELGHPDRKMIYDVSPLYANAERKVFVTQRGCPMNCSFCFHHAWKKNLYESTNRTYVRKRTVDHIIEELQWVKANYPLKFVHFVDDIFNLSNKWLDEFCERYPKEVGIPFDVILMANMTTEKHIEQLRSAGCVYARIAIEAASDYIRNAVFRKNTTRKQLTDAAGWIKKHGIRLGTLNMLGGPGGTIEDEWDTIKLNIECKTDHPLASIMQPYPGFDINEMTKDMGYAVSGYDDFPHKFNRTSSIEFENKHVIENLHKWFPIVVRHPWLMPVAKKAIHIKVLARVYLIMYMLYSEYLVAEQTQTYARAQGDEGLRHWAPFDFVYRLGTKGVLRVYQGIFPKLLGRFFSPSQASLRLQMGDERVIAHMD